MEFHWMVGEESSDPLVSHDGVDVRIDELATTGHYDHLEQDLAAVAAMGVTLVRYGMNWRRTEPEPGVYDWALWDRALGAFDRLGLEVVADLLHFGVPAWLDGISDPRLTDAFLRFTEAFLGRYRDITWFTPVNEPFITAATSTWWGIWNERVADDATFVTTLARLCQADLLASEMIRADRPARFLQSEAFGFEQPRSVDPGVLAKADLDNAVRLLSFDLRYGIEPLPVLDALIAHLPDDLRADLAARATTEGVVAGHDYYPVSRTFDADIRYEGLARCFHDRYQVPFAISETSNLGLPPTEAGAWLAELTEDIALLRADGLPCIGLCWYSRGDQHDWDSMLTIPRHQVTEVGLFDLERRRRPAADVFEQLVAAGAP